MGTPTEGQVAHVTALLSIGEGGETDATKAVERISAGTQVTVSSPTVASEVLRYYGCSQEYITDRINYALFGTTSDDHLIG